MKAPINPVRSTTISTFIIAYGAIAIFAALTAWVVMLALGALHHDVSTDVPALGFLVVWLGCIAVAMVVKLFR